MTFWKIMGEVVGEMADGMAEQQARERGCKLRNLEHLVVGKPAVKPLNRDQLGPMLESLRDECFDDGRIAIVALLLKSEDRGLSGAQLDMVLGTFTFDDGRMTVIRMLSDRIVDPYRAKLYSFTFQSERTRARSLLAA